MLGALLLHCKTVRGTNSMIYIDTDRKKEIWIDFNKTLNVLAYLVTTDSP